MNPLHPLPNIQLDAAARKALDLRERPLYVEMELYFSCLIRKRLLFHEQAPAHLEWAETEGGKLRVGYSWMMTKACNLGEVKGGEPPLVPFPGDPQKKRACWPKWLKLGFRRGAWTGEYGLGRQK
ncbi:MAG: hypothetical protein RRB13_06530 [bacterium]|nr:hypothetical protein [bacterium]